MPEYGIESAIFAQERRLFAPSAPEAAIVQSAPVRGGGEDIYPKGVNAGQSVFRDGTH